MRGVEKVNRSARRWRLAVVGNGLRNAIHCLWFKYIVLVWGDRLDAVLVDSGRRREMRVRNRLRSHSRPCTAEAWLMVFGRARSRRVWAGSYLLFRHHFLAVHETRRRADALHVAAPAMAVAEAGEGGEAAAVNCAEATDLLWWEHVVH